MECFKACIGFNDMSGLKNSGGFVESSKIRSKGLMLDFTKFEKSDEGIAVQLAPPSWLHKSRLPNRNSEPFNIYLMEEFLTSSHRTMLSFPFLTSPIIEIPGGNGKDFTLKSELYAGWRHELDDSIREPIELTVNLTNFSLDNVEFFVPKNYLQEFIKHKKRKLKGMYSDGIEDPWD